MEHDDTVLPEVRRYFGDEAFGFHHGVAVAVHLRFLGHLGPVHFVHGPDVVEEVRGAEPGVRLRNVVGGFHHVPAARVPATCRAGHATEQRLHRGNLSVKFVCG